VGNEEGGGIMLGKVTVVQDDKKAVFIELQEPTKLKLGDEVEIKKYRRKRTLSQNRLYWAYLTWCISEEGGGLIDQGHFSPDALHQDIKCWVQSKYPNQFDMEDIFTTTELNTKQFNEYLELVDRELMVKFFGIDTSRFWGEVEDKSLPF
jgi:hypothetical protein